MNFKKTCKSIVSFVLGTGMMFSGFAFNNYSNAFFPEEFYAENLEKYNGNENMKLLLTSLEKLHDNRKALRDKVSQRLITEAKTRIVEALSEFGKAVEEVTNALDEKERAQQIAVLTALKAVPACEAFNKARQAFDQAAQSATAEIKKPNRNEDSVGQEYDKLNDNTKQLDDNRDEMRTAVEQLEAVSKKLQIATDNCEQKTTDALKSLNVLLKYLIVLAVCETDESKRLCLDDLAINMATLFNDDPTTLNEQLNAVKTNLFGRYPMK